MFGMASFAEISFAESGPQNAVIELAGVTANGVAGTPTSAIQVSLMGVMVSTSVGTVDIGIPAEISGVFATGSVGSVGFGGTSVALTGVTGTGQTGQLLPFDTVNGAAVFANAFPGTVSSGLTIALSGVSAVATEGSVGPGKGFGISGVAATGTVGSVQNSQTASLLGATGTGVAGDVGVFFWQLIQDDTVLQNWQNVNTTDGVTWVDVDTAGDPDWRPVEMIVA
jgi:hypothetical protein